MSAKGGITKGKSHKEGGIPMVVKSTGQQVELEGGEAVINKRNMSSDKKFEFEGKEMTTCEIASAINSANGNGVKIDCDDVTGKKYAYENGGVVFIGYKDDEIMYEPIDKKYYANDVEFDSLEEAQKFLDSGGVNENLRGAYERGLFADGGDIRSFSWYQDFKKKPLSEQLKKGTKHEMEHVDTINEFKKKGVSDKEVAEAIAKDHLSENENYYIELDKMESSKKLSDAINDFDKQKGYRKNTRKYKVGGSMIDGTEIIHLKFEKDFDGVIRQKDGKYVSESLFPKDKVYKFTFLYNDGRHTALEFGNTNNYILVPNDIIKVVGFNDKLYGNGGAIKSYQSFNLDSNDKSILNMLREIASPYSVTSEQREKLSSFKGNNVVNNLSSKLIQKIYGILFKNHNVNNKILNLYLSNIGVGNILLFAPTYLNKTLVSFDEHNNFNQVEKDIADIVTLGKRASLYNDFEMQDVDGIIHVYAESNPEVDMLTELFLKTNKKAIALGVCEFTSRQKLNEFQRSILVNQGKIAQNQMIMFKKSNEYYVINEGITDKGQYTLIYTMTKY